MEQVGVKDNYRLVQNLKSAGCFIVCILLTLVCHHTVSAVESVSWLSEQLDYRSWFYDFDRILLCNDCIRFDCLSVQGS